MYMYQQLSAPSSYTYSSSTGSNSNNLETLAQYSRESAFASILKGWESPGAADSTPKGPKAASTSTPETPSVCMGQRPGAGGWGKQRRRLGIL